MNASLALAVVALALYGCGRDQPKNWRNEMICIGSIPGVEGPLSEAIGQDFKDHKIRYVLDGSVAWAIYVRSNDVERARLVLRNDTNLFVISETEGKLQLNLR